MPSGTITLYQIIGYVYKLSHNTNKDLKFYIGSCENTANRSYKHKSDCHNVKADNYNFPVYQYIRQNGGWKNWQMRAILKSGRYEELESVLIRRSWDINTNAMIPFRSQKQYRLDNKESISMKKGKVCICERCGEKYTHTHRSRHLRSKYCLPHQE